MDNDKINAANSLLTPLQAEKNPHFSEVLKGVFQHKLNNDFVTKSKAEERQKVFKEFSKARSSYESIKLVYDTIWDIIADKNLDSKSVEKLEESFLSAELKESMMKLPKGSEDPSEKTDFLHVFGTEVNTVPLDDDIRVWTVKQIQEKMVQRGIGILKQLGQDVEGQNPRLVVAKLNQLPSLVKDRLEELENQKKAQEEYEAAMKENYFKYITTLLEGLKIMENLVEKHIIEIQIEQYATNTESLKVQCDALLLKIKSLYLEILVETYTKETLPALKKISSDLTKQTQEVEGEIQASRMRLNRYESVGPEFNAVVNEYSQLRETIKQKKWTLEKLKSYCP